MKRTFIALTLLFTLCRAAFAQDGLPVGWMAGGNKPDHFEMKPDTTVKQGGTASACVRFVAPKFEGFGTLMQQFKADAWRGKRVRMSAWVKTDSLKSVAYIKLFAHGLYGTLQGIASEQFSVTQPWTLTTQTLDLPPDTYQVWAWCQYDGPVRGKVHFDDVSLEVLGPATVEP